MFTGWLIALQSFTLRCAFIDGQSEKKDLDDKEQDTDDHMDGDTNSQDKDNVSEGIEVENHLKYIFFISMLSHDCPIVIYSTKILVPNGIGNSRDWTFLHFIQDAANDFMPFLRCFFLGLHINYVIKYPVAQYITNVKSIFHVIFIEQFNY